MAAKRKCVVCGRVFTPGKSEAGQLGGYGDKCARDQARARRNSKHAGDPNAVRSGTKKAVVLVHCEEGVKTGLKAAAKAAGETVSQFCLRRLKEAIGWVEAAP